ncbi:hypothetical protein HOLleu_42781 [Holothuria leucospilota]|uniref:DUF5641 domain-containing protein n=1 Tax=Holothuria leucospilota TaxID=206669 RepID=A0A9Q0YCH3_HOLLE|nr:hypothetical protein HOLleu_42781 [Holothuria leucospilota]
MVLVDGGSTRGNWPLGRVVEVFPRGDGNVRVANLQVGKNILTRPITKLYLVVGLKLKGEYVNDKVLLCYVV